MGNSASDANMRSSSATSEPTGGCPVPHDAAPFGSASCSGCPESGRHDDKDEEEGSSSSSLGKHRAHSTIPRGDKDATWAYPSEHMFMAALKRKGEDGDVEEQDVASVVAIHNEMNEQVWQQIEQFEQLCHPNSAPRLLSFRGRPNDLTPLAWMKKMFGQGTPFDRHDWMVVREDGEQVRYVIDFYYDESANEDLKGTHGPITTYARPAVNSVQSLVDRIKFPVLARWPQAAVSNQADLSAQELSKDDVKAAASKIQTSCAIRFAAVQNCENTVECTGAATALQLCMANVICPARAHAFRAALDRGDEQEIENAFDAMNNGIDVFQEKSRKALGRE